MARCKQTDVSCTAQRAFKSKSFPSGNERAKFNEQQQASFDGRRSGVQWR